MCLGEIGHVDIIADSGTVRRGIVGAEHLKVRSQPHRHLHNDRHQVRRISLKPVHPALRVVSRRIEVAQRRKLESLEPVVPLETALDFELGKTVKIGGILRVRFIDRQIFRLAIDRRRRRKHEARNLRFARGIENADRARQVLNGVFLRPDHGFSRSLGRGEVHHCVIASLHDRHNRPIIEDILFEETAIRKQILSCARGQIVEHIDLETAVCKKSRDVAADISGTTDNKHIHAGTSPEF